MLQIRHGSRTDASRRSLFDFGDISQGFQRGARMYFWLKLHKWLLSVYIDKIGVRGDIRELKFYKNKIR